MARYVEETVKLINKIITLVICGLIMFIGNATYEAHARDERQDAEIKGINKYIEKIDANMAKRDAVTEEIRKALTTIATVSVRCEALKDRVNRLERRHERSEAH